ncbi:MAG: hypothetical protein C4524_05610 [Candidatus Zixiibacteriota bacterium]|nr:MAG: hypothetical protein C4524_05610 [candidate division Zixibacteria bacterium]
MKLPRPVIAGLAFLGLLALAWAQPQTAPQPADDVLKRVTRLVNRLEQVNRTLQQDAQKKPAQAAQIQRVQQLGAALSETVVRLRASLESYFALRNDQTLMADPVMQKAADQMRDHLGGVTDRLEQAVQVTEQMAKKLHFGTAGQ